MRRLALLSVLVLAVAIVSAISLGSRPGPVVPGPPAGQATAVTSVTRSCPPAAPGTGPARVALISVPAPATATATATGPVGSATVSAVTPAPGPAKAPPAKSAAGKTAPAAGKTAPATTAPATTAPATTAAAKSAPAKSAPAKSAPGETAAARPVTVSAVGTAALVTAPGAGAGTGGAALTVTGRMAQGFEAEESTASGTGLVSCGHPGSDLWFAGAGQSDGAPVIRLYLMNTGTLAASANVTILTDSGQQDGLSGTITVGPHQTVTENIAKLVPGSLALGLQVQASSGQIAAAVWEGSQKGGGAWLPQADAPGTSLVIPGLTVASSAARLFVTVPGSAEAKLTVRAYTAAGVVTQYLGTQADVSAGATTMLTLSSLGSSVAGLEVTSSVPVVASVLVPGAGIGSFTTAQPPVTEQGVVAGNPATKGVTVGLLLTAPSAAATASIAVVSADGTITVVAKEVTVAARHSRAVTVPRPPGPRQPFAIVVTPRAGSGPLYAARVVTAGSGGLSAKLTALLPVPSARTWITLPTVRDAYTAVLP